MCNLWKKDIYLSTPNSFDQISPCFTIFETSLNFTRISHEEPNQMTIILIIT